MRDIKKNIVLIGMPGCGKTIIGKLLAEILNMKFCDVDAYIEKITEKSILDIFKDGEVAFREIERDAVKEVSKKKSIVISTGGGVVKSFTNIERLKENGIIIFINRSVENIILDVDISKRPLLRNKKEKIYEIYKERYSLYKKYCDYEVMNDVELETVVDKIINILSAN